MEITFFGEKLALIGQQPAVNDPAPNATVYDEEGHAVELKDLFKDHVTILSVVPDITTKVCSLQTQRFADGTKEHDVQYLTISRNKQEDFTAWKKEHDLDIRTLTDDDHSFGKHYGLEIEGKDILARAVFVVDGNGQIVYEQIVPEATHEPEYDAAIEKALAVKE